MPKKNFIPKDFDTSIFYKDAATKYGVSISTIFRWRKATKNNQDGKIQRDIKINDGILGILWAIGGDNGECFFIRCRHREIVEEVREYFDMDNLIIVGSSNTNIQYKLKITGDIRKSILKTLDEYGWNNRNADQRNIPVLENYRDFLRAYIELHSGLDYSTRYSRDKKRKYKSLRLRIYGNKILIQSVSQILRKAIGIGFKKPSILNNDKTAVLTYQSLQEIEEIYKWLDGEPYLEKYWDDVYEKLANPKIEH